MRKELYLFSSTLILASVTTGCVAPYYGTARIEPGGMLRWVWDTEPCLCR